MLREGALLTLVLGNEIEREVDDNVIDGSVLRLTEGSEIETEILGRLAEIPEPTAVEDNVTPPGTDGKVVVIPVFRLVLGSEVVDSETDPTLTLGIETVGEVEPRPEKLVDMDPSVIEDKPPPVVLVGNTFVINDSALDTE